MIYLLCQIVLWAIVLLNNNKHKTDLNKIIHIIHNLNMFMKKKLSEKQTKKVQ